MEAKYLKLEEMTAEEQTFLAGSLAGYRAARGSTQTPRRAADEGTPEKKDWTKIQAVCPHCEKTKVVDPDFGIRKVRGVERRQPWCRQCRSTTNYHNQPRKYNKARR